MFTRLAITNFQAHTKLVLGLDPLVTTIIGPTDVGKSAILRALRWLCLNKPVGEEFLRHGERDASVRLWVDGRKVLRRRGSSNLYKLDGKAFRAFRDTVPPEIAKLLNVQDVNFQWQHDAPFWFSQTAGQVSRELNAVVNLGEMDESLSRLASKLREANSAANVSQSRLATATQRKQELKYVPILEGEFHHITTLEDGVVRKHARAREAASLVSQVKEHQRDREQACNAAREGRNLVIIGSKVQKLWERVEELTSLLHGIRRTGEESKVVRHQAKQAEQNLSKKMGGRCPLCRNKL